MIDFLQLRIDALGIPAKTEWHMNGVHAEVAHHSDRAAGFDLAFPVGGLGGIEVAAVVEARADFQNLSQIAFAGDLIGPLRSRQERKLRAATHKTAAGFRCIRNRTGGFQVDAKRFLGEQVLSRFEHIEINRFVHVVRHGDIDDIDIRAGQKLVIVGGEKLHRGNPAEPLALLLRQIADGGEFRLDREIFQNKPA